MSKTDRAWKKWGEKDPYYGVFSSPEYRSDRLSKESLAQFFASGEEHVESVFSTIRSKLDPDFSPEFAVDYGCGTGRLAIPLARRCSKVLGIDISPTMLQETMRNAATEGLDNIRALEPASALPSLANVDLVHSFIVMQHIPPRAGLKIIKTLVSSLSPGGCIALHVTYERSASRLRKLANWARHNIIGAHTIFQLLQRKPLADAPMQMNHYPMNHLLKQLHCHGFDRLHLEFTNHDGFLGVVIFGQLPRKTLQT